MPVSLADDKNFGGLTYARSSRRTSAMPLAPAARMDRSTRLPLERYDSVGRYRTRYADGNVIDDEGVLADKTRSLASMVCRDYLQRTSGCCAP